MEFIHKYIKGNNDNIYYHYKYGICIKSHCQCFILFLIFLKLWKSKFFHMNNKTWKGHASCIVAWMSSKNKITQPLFFKKFYKITRTLICSWNYDYVASINFLLVAHNISMYLSYWKIYVSRIFLVIFCLQRSQLWHFSPHKNSKKIDFVCFHPSF